MPLILDKLRSWDTIILFHFLLLGVRLAINKLKLLNLHHVSKELLGINIYI